MKGTIIVATHKEYAMPTDSVYLPVYVGKDEMLEKKYITDRTGENISHMNSTYCELTAVYWAWKNLPNDKRDFVGLAHYRRHFTLHRKAKSLSEAITGKEVSMLFNESDDGTIITIPVTKYPMSIEKHYVHSEHGYEQIQSNDIQVLRDTIKHYYPQYSAALEKVLGGKCAHMKNMFIMRNHDFDKYCEWLFGVLEIVVTENGKRVDQRRYAGAMSEFLLDVWCIKNNKTIREVCLLEPEYSLKKKILKYVKIYIKRIMKD